MSKQYVLVVTIELQIFKYVLAASGKHPLLETTILITNTMLVLLLRTGLYVKLLWNSYSLIYFKRQEGRGVPTVEKGGLNYSQTYLKDFSGHK